MNDFVKNLPAQPTYEQRGLKGYKLPLQNKDMELYYVDVSQGHDNYEISKKCTHIYYIFEGEGKFEIDGIVSDVGKGELIEVIPGAEYTFWGQMKLLTMMTPPFFEGNGEITRPNHNVK